MRGVKAKVLARKSQVISSRQHAYLDAMDIGIWSLRESPCLATPPVTIPPGLKLGPGGGGILLVCAADTDSATRLANDIARALGGVPVWAWPHVDPGAIKLPNAVEENLFTTVAIFGSDLAIQFFNGDPPPSVQSANLVLLPSMQDIQDRAEARQLLWSTFCRSGMVSASVV